MGVGKGKGVGSGLGEGRAVAVGGGVEDGVGGCVASGVSPGLQPDRRKSANNTNTKAAFLMMCHLERKHIKPGLGLSAGQKVTSVWRYKP